MSWRVIDNKIKLMQIFNHLIIKKTKIKIKVEGETAEFFSKFIKVNPGEGSSDSGHGPELILEKLRPDKGNSLIQHATEVIGEFVVNKNHCKCNINVTSTSNIQPDSGFMVIFPESVEIEEKRREERFQYARPEFVAVEFRTGKGSDKDKMHRVNILDHSVHGLGMIITQKDFDLLETLKDGDKLRDMTLYARESIIKVEGSIRHRTKIGEGKYKGSYILGIESPEIIENGVTK